MTYLIKKLRKESKKGWVGRKKILLPHPHLIHLLIHALRKLRKVVVESKVG